MKVSLPLAFAATCLVACSKSPPPSPKRAPPSAPSASANATAAASASAVRAANGGSAGRATPSAEHPALPGPLNVILLSIDSMRQDMPWAGYPKAIAPNLTKLASESVVYTHAYAVSSYTAKSVGAFLTSRYPSSLYRSGYFFTAYAKSNVFLAEVLHEHDIRTLAVHAHLYFARGKHLDQGFDVWDLVPGITFDATTDKNITSDKMTDIGIRLLSDPANTSKPFFAWLHYTDPHDQYQKHPESPVFGKDTRAHYDGEVFFTDLHVGRLLDFARKQPWWGKTAVIVTADHGEAFGEHGMYHHAFWLWDVLTRVPLVVHAPGAAPARIDEKRSLIDLAPTILDLEGVHEKPPTFVGRSLVPEIFGVEKPGNREPIVLDLPEDGQNPEVRAVISGDKKLIVYSGGRSELYDLHADPGELHDLSKSEPEALATLKAEFKRVWSTIPIVRPYGGNKLRSGKTADGPMGPAK